MSVTVVLFLRHGGAKTPCKWCCVSVICILLETKLAKPDKEVFQLQFAVGEFDMVVADSKALTCEIYEIKHSKEVVPAQYRHLMDEEKCAQTEHRYGAITARTVIYRGETTENFNVKYVNAEEYLKKLG